MAHCEALSREPSGAQNPLNQGKYFTYWETKVFLRLICYMINAEPTVFLDDDIVFELVCYISKNDRKECRNE